MEDSFYFSLLRIPIAQILKTQGFDKCKPSTLNTLTSLYIIYLTKLISESINCSLTRTRTNSPDVQDVMQAMINMGLIKATQSNKIHDSFFDELEYNTKSINLFRNWVMSYYGDQIRDISRRKQRELENTATDEEELKVDENKDQQHPQDIYHQFILRNDRTNSKQDNDNSKEGENEDTQSSTHSNKSKWLNHLLEKDLKLGHKLKYLYATEFIADEFEEYLQDQVRRSNSKDANGGANDENELDLDLQLKIKSVQNSGWNDYIVKPITKEVKPKDNSINNVVVGGGGGEDGGVVDELIKKEADLEKYLPYNIKYSEQLLTDDIEVGDDNEDADDDMEDSESTAAQQAEI